MSIELLSKVFKEILICRRYLDGAEYKSEDEDFLNWVYESEKIPQE